MDRNRRDSANFSEDEDDDSRKDEELHSNGSEELLKFKCSFSNCELRFATTRQLIIHKRNYHWIYYECMLCIAQNKDIPILDKVQDIIYHFSSQHPEIHASLRRTKVKECSGRDLRSSGNELATDERRSKRALQQSLDLASGGVDKIPSSKSTMATTTQWINDQTNRTLHDDSLPDNNHNRVEVILAEKDKHLEEMKVLLAEKDKHLEEMKVLLAEKDKHLEEMKVLSAEKEKQRARGEMLLEIADSQNQVLDKKLSAKEEESQILYGENERLTERLIEKDLEIQEIQLQCTGLLRKTMKLEQESRQLQEMRSASDVETKLRIEKLEELVKEEKRRALEARDWYRDKASKEEAMNAKLKLEHEKSLKAVEERCKRRDEENQRLNRQLQFLKSKCNKFRSPNKPYRQSQRLKEYRPSGQTACQPSDPSFTTTVPPYTLPQNQQLWNYHYGDFGNQNPVTGYVGNGNQGQHPVTG